jgi:rod shape-determining protein MreB and related proteins
MIELGIIVNTRATEIEVTHNGTVTRKMTFLPAGVELTTALVDYLKSKHSLRIDRLSAEGVLMIIGSAAPADQERTMLVRGQGADNSLPQEVEVSSQGIHQSIATVVEQLVSASAQRIQHIISMMQDTTLDDTRIVLKGEFKHLNNLDKRLTEAIGATVVVGD